MNQLVIDGALYTFGGLIALMAVLLVILIMLYVLNFVWDYVEATIEYKKEIIRKTVNNSQTANYYGGKLFGFHRKMIDKKYDKGVRNEYP